MSGGRVRILELRSVRGTGGGPEKTILRGAGRADRTQFDVLVCYIRDRRDGVFAIDAQAKALGVEYVEVPERHSLDPAVWPALRSLVRDRHIDIVHSHEYKTDLLAWLLARFEAVIPLATVHGWTGHSPRERMIYYPLDKRLLARFPRLIAVSEEIRGELIRCGARADRVTTVLNGIEPDAFRRDRAKEAAIRQELGLSAGDVIVGSVGRLEPQKRFDLLIDAVAALRHERPALKLVIAGDGSQRAFLEARVAERHLGGIVRLLGHRTDVQALHHAFDLFVQASDYEGTPNAVLEAMAMETPTVATAAGGTAEILRDGIDGTIVSTGDSTVLAAAIRAALADPATTRSRAARARTRIETDLSFATRTGTVERIYRELADGRGHSRRGSAA